MILYTFAVTDSIHVADLADRCAWHGLVEATPEQVCGHPAAVAQAEVVRNDERSRCVHIARGCQDYRGGHSGHDLDIYRLGMRTVANALAAPRSDFQACLLASIGAAEADLLADVQEVLAWLEPQTEPTDSRARDALRRLWARCGP